MILERYVAGRFLKAFAGALAALVGLYVVVDGIERLDEFLEAGLGMSLRVCAYQMPLIVGQLVPIVTLVAAVFTVLSLQRRNELWAMVSAGVSVYRSLLPVMAAAVMLMVGLWANQEWLVPKVAPRLMHARKAVFGGEKFSYYDVLVPDRWGKLFWMRRYDFVEKVMYDVAVMDFYPSGEPRAYYRAERAESVDGEPRGWTLHDYTALFFLRGGERDTSKGVGGKEDGEMVLVETDLAPGAIGAKQLEAGFMGISQAYRLVKERPDLGGVKVALHAKVAFPISTVVLLLVGLPSALRWGGKSYLLGAGVGLMVAFLFLSFYVASIEVGNRGELPAVIAAWFPISSFGAVGLYLFGSIRT